MSHELLKNFPVVLEWPVAWGEMDSWGHVNNVAYVRYFESARIAYFEKMNYLNSLATTDSGPIVAAQSCRYRMPLYYPDDLLIGARVSSLYTYGFFHEYCLVSRKHNRVAASGECRLTIINYKTGEKLRVGADLQKTIEDLEGRKLPINEFKRD
jgi:acyl-CoA thioester hydrolase